MLIRFLNGPDTEKREEHFSPCPFADFYFSLCLTLLSFFLSTVHTPNLSSALQHPFSLFPPQYLLLYPLSVFGGKTDSLHFF